MEMFILRNIFFKLVDDGSFSFGQNFLIVLEMTCLCVAPHARRLNDTIYLRAEGVHIRTRGPSRGPDGRRVLAAILLGARDPT